MFLVFNTPYTTYMVKQFFMLQCTRFISDTRPVYIFGLDTSLALARICLCPPEETISIACTCWMGTTAYFLIRILSIWMNPVVSVGSNPPSSSIDDWCSSYRPYRVACQTERVSPRQPRKTYLVRVPSLDDHVPLEQLQTDNPVHGPLTRRNRARHKLTLGREKVAIV